MMFRVKGFHLCVLLLSVFTACSQQGSDRIQLNQVGFVTSSPKLAVITGKTEGGKFYITANGSTYFTGTLSDEKQSKNSSTVTRIADFSAFKREGVYHISVPGVGTSYEFRIAEDVFSDVSKAVLKAYYYMRSDMPLEKTYAGKWARAAGHPDTTVLVHASAASDARPAGTVISSPKGWYDAGDYNKYVVNSGITMGTLLSAYEDFPGYFDKLKTNIPESSDAVPDILNEVLYNLRWMLSMQDPNDGGVYHKLTNAAFDGMVAPGVTKAPRYVVQKSTAATLDFAAVMAQSSRVLGSFKKQLPHLADSCLAAANKAWDWAEKNPSILYDQRGINQKFDPDITTGEYGDRSVNDEWFWAATELYTSTKENKFLAVINERIKDRVALPGWNNVTMLGYYTFIRNEKNLQSCSSLIQMMKDTVLRFANLCLTNYASNAFGTVIGGSQREFIWGSNSIAANEGVLLINAYKITSDRKYIEAALSNLDYILGRNATNYCFVTGIGTKSPMHPHHRPSVSDNIVEPIPGMLVGGPNPGQQDHCAYPFKEPESSYVDSDCAYAANEIAINWNAPLVYLTNALRVLWK
ncbi:MAG: glycoside hydrolase family 9 protein [Flavisolibacter sp.]